MSRGAAAQPPRFLEGTREFPKIFSHQGYRGGCVWAHEFFSADQKALLNQWIHGIYVENEIGEKFWVDFEWRSKVAAISLKFRDLIETVFTSNGFFSKSDLEKLFKALISF